MNFSKLLTVAEEAVNLIEDGIKTTHTFIDESQEIAMDIKDSISEEGQEDDEESN